MRAAHRRPSTNEGSCSAGDLLTLASSVSVVMSPARQLINVGTGAVPQLQKLGATR